MLLRIRELREDKDFNQEEVAKILNVQQATYSRYETGALEISLDDLLHLFRTNIELANWGRIIHQNEYRRLHRSHKDRLTLSAKERYEEFKRQFPHIYQRVQLGYVASYLGITLPTLSRLRAQK